MFLVDEKSERMFNRVGEIAGEYGICFWTVINLWMRSVWIIRWTMPDDVGHLNYLGNQKYTKVSRNIHKGTLYGE